MGKANPSGPTGFERIYPAASKTKRKTNLNRKHRRMYASKSFQRFVAAEKARKAREQNANIA